jgi:hypothetical protein
MKKNHLLVIGGIMILGLCRGPLGVKAETLTPDYHQTTGIEGNLPIFYQQLKAKLTFPLAWTSGNYSDFTKWRQTARAKVLEKIIQIPDQTPFSAKVIDEQDRETYLARKIIFNLTAESRVLGLMLVPKGAGPFPAALLLHDHGSEFEIGKEKMIEPWGNETSLKTAQAWSEKYFSGRFIGNELVNHGYVVLAVDALGWGDRGGLTYEAQQALSCNLMALGSSLAGLMAYEDIRIKWRRSAFRWVPTGPGKWRPYRMRSKPESPSIGWGPPKG